MAKTRKKDADETAFEIPADPEVPAAPQSAGDTMAAADERDRIAARAYELYLARGAADGEAMEDWLAAEREFANRNNDDRRSGE